MSQLAQDKRLAQLQTPLGKDVLVLASFVAMEGLSGLFEVNVEALSERENINFDDAIGRACTIKQITYDNKIRYYNGILTATRLTGKTKDLSHYHLVLRPWLWLLGRKTDCRIFLDEDVKEIISEVFRKAGFTDFVFRTTGDFHKIPYCVQYRETDLAFCSRMMEHYGIYYFFEHADGKHTLVMADARTSHKSIPDLPKLPFIPRHAGATRTEQHVHSWVSDRKLRTGGGAHDVDDALGRQVDDRGHKAYRARRNAHSALGRACGRMDRRFSSIRPLIIDSNAATHDRAGHAHRDPDQCLEREAGSAPGLSANLHRQRRQACGKRLMRIDREEEHGRA